MPLTHNHLTLKATPSWTAAHHKPLVLHWRSPHSSEAEYNLPIAASEELDTTIRRFVRVARG